MFGGVAALGLEAADMALWVPAHARWLTADEWADGVAHERYWVHEGATLQLRLSPERDAADVVWLLHNSKDAPLLALCSELPIRLVDAHFGSAFTEYGGVETLLGLATEREDPPEVQAQALAALSSAIAFPQAMERLLSADGAARLVRITHADMLASEHIASAVCAALDLLSALCMRSDGFVIVHGATVRIASEREEPIPPKRRPSRQSSSSRHRRSRLQSTPCSAGCRGKALYRASVA